MIALHNPKIITFYPPTVSEECDIIIDGENIIDVGKNIIRNYSSEITLELSGKYISPGLVCSHNHLYSFLARGIIADIKPSRNLNEILEHLWWKLDKALNQESIYYSAVTAGLEAIRCGTTAVIDHHASPSCIRGSLGIISSAFSKLGLRGILAYEITDRNGEKDVNYGIEETVEFISSDKNSSIIKGTVGAHASFTLSDYTLSILEQVIDATGRGVHIHAAESEYDQLHAASNYNKSVIRRFADAGLLNEKAILAHGVHLKKTDIDIINHYDSFVIHNPRSNMNNSVGYLDKLDEFNNTALGTDGIGSDMFEELKFAYFRNREAENKCDADILLKTLQNGNKILRRYFERPFGKIEKGYPADIVIYDYTPPTPMCGENLAGHMIFGSLSKDIETVIINGSIVYKNRAFRFNTNDLYTSARESAALLWKKINGIYV